MSWSILGLIAGAICISGFIPQIIKGYKTKKMEDVSFLMILLLGVGMFLWVLYGSHLNLIPVIVTNIAGVTCAIILMIMKFAYSKNRYQNIKIH